MTEDEKKKEHVMEDIPGGLITALHKITGEKGRWNLECLRVENKKIVVADGGVMARIELPVDLGETALFQFPKPNFKKSQPVAIIRDNQSVQVRQTEGNATRIEEYEENEKARWPEEYERAIPDEKGDVELFTKIDSLSRAIDVIKSLGYTKVKMTVNNKTGEPFRMDGVQDDYTRQPKHEIGITVAVGTAGE